jgi:TonB family protein
LGYHHPETSFNRSVFGYLFPELCGLKSKNMNLFKLADVRGSSRFWGGTAALALHCAILLVLLQLSTSGQRAAADVLHRGGEEGAIEVSLLPSSQPASTASGHLHKNTEPQRDQPDPVSDAVSPVVVVGNLVSGQEPVRGQTITVGGTDGPQSNYEQTLLIWIDRHKRNPGTDILSGKVQVGFRLARDGHVLDAWLVSSSGIAQLDREAVATVLRSQPLPVIPPDLSAPLNFSFEIDFT